MEFPFLPVYPSNGRLLIYATSFIALLGKNSSTPRFMHCLFQFFAFVGGYQFASDWIVSMLQFNNGHFYNFFYCQGWVVARKSLNSGNYYYV